MTEKEFARKIAKVNEEIATKKAELEALYSLKVDLFNELFAYRWNHGERNMTKLTAEAKPQ